MSKSILVIDDSITNLVLLEAVMEEEGYKTVLASNVAEGLKAMREQKPSLILLDLLMPKRSGIDFLEEMRKESQYGDVPVFVVTAGNEELKFQVKEFGVAGYFTKPIDIKTLTVKVKEVLNGKKD